VLKRNPFLTHCTGLRDPPGAPGPRRSSPAPPPLPLPLRGALRQEGGGTGPYRTGPVWDRAVQATENGQEINNKRKSHPPINKLVVLHDSIMKNNQLTFVSLSQKGDIAENTGTDLISLI
jgi:hypothetical protein